MYEFIQNSDFTARSALFVIFARGTPLISGFQESAWVWAKKRFQHEISTFWHFRTVRAHHFLAIFSIVHEFVQNSVSARSTFSHFLLGAPRFRDFQQSARVCGKQLFQPEISTSRHFCPGHTTFQRFSAKCTSLSKTAFLARHQQFCSFRNGSTSFSHFKRTARVCTFFSAQDQHVFSPRSASFVIFALGYHFLAIFIKVHDFVQNSVFSPRLAPFVIVALTAPLVSVFNKKNYLLQIRVFSPRAERFVIFALGTPPF